MFRVGFGYDVHRLTSGRPLILGGVTIPHNTGLDGHSDADVLTHALIDALFGALAMGDIGTHFPDTDPAYKDCSSIKLLETTAGMLRRRGWYVSNVDTTICAQVPKIAPFIFRMRRNLAAAMDVETGRISVKATTTERLGFVGRIEGIASYAVVSVINSSPNAGA
ncbi:MAG TPA: 2-C-methyl-D-erythritol 2,4-cyclodiphosphate synthase [Desulfobacteraceae bacterium]|nr:2-C-methyl-D-erythritol 2,4-cyclodiphosphate synthase [Desulfobacteraceae bacterium]